MAKFEITVPDDTMDIVRKLQARKEKSTETKVTLADMCAELVVTGAARRQAANKWADAHPTVKKPRKAPKAKAVKAPKAKAVKAPKAKLGMTKKPGFKTATKKAKLSVVQKAPASMPEPTPAVDATTPDPMS